MNGFTIIATIFIIIGLVVLSIFISMVIKIRTCKKWPTTDGTVISTTYPLGPTEYEYNVDGKNYTSDRIYRFWRFFYSPFEWFFFAKRTWEAYPKGTQVKVFYDPDNPEMAILNREFNWTWLFILFYSGAFLFVGIFALTI